MVDPLSNFWCNKGSGMCYPVCGMVDIKESLLLIGKSGPLPYVRRHITVNKMCLFLLFLLSAKLVTINRVASRFN